MQLDLNFLQGKKLGIVGMGVTGRAVFNAVLPYVESVIWYDDKMDKLDGLSQHFAHLDSKIWYQLDMLIMSPGCPITYPAPHPLYSLAKAQGIPVHSDIDLLCQAEIGKKFVTVTGTNGKSTTVSLIHHILSCAEMDFVVAGNIGKPVLSCEQHDGYLLELSSFQLDITSSLHSNIAVILNITPDHLERHGNMKEYIAAKCKIFQNMTADDALILNVDNPYVNEIYLRLRESGQVSLYPFSVNNILDDGISVIGGVLHDNRFTHAQYSFVRTDALRGPHNSENIAASIICSAILGVNIGQAIENFTSFSSLPHRMQFVGQKQKVKFINDSKATNIASTIQALKAFKNIYWLAGGIAKSDDIQELATCFSSVKHGFFFGSTRHKLSDLAKERELPYSVHSTMEDALHAAILKSASGAEDAVVLLSPACSSFDQFDNFAHRGRVFTEIVEEHLKC